MVRKQEIALFAERNLYVLLSLRHCQSLSVIVGPCPLLTNQTKYFNIMFGNMGQTLKSLF